MKFVGKTSVAVIKSAILGRGAFVNGLGKLKVKRYLCSDGKLGFLGITVEDNLGRID